MLLSLLATDALRTYCRSAQCVWVFAELYIACLLRCGTLAGNIKVDFCRSFKVASMTAASAGVRERVCRGKQGGLFKLSGSRVRPDHDG